MRTVTTVPTTCLKCKKEGKIGILFDVTSRLAEALHVKHVKCDVCGKTFAFKVQA